MSKREDVSDSEKRWIIIQTAQALMDDAQAVNDKDMALRLRLHAAFLLGSLAEDPR